MRLVSPAQDTTAAPAPFPAGRPGQVCLTCHLADPPPDPDCTEGRDHYIGRIAGCRNCGRLPAACARRPCSARRQR